jgi:hypothetical protein
MAVKAAMWGKCLPEKNGVRTLMLILLIVIVDNF